jgi:hypothetical protein
VRNHASWARSAYLQWGIKHKTYRGKIKPFNKWYESRKDGFTKTISTYEKNFPGCVSVRNYDAVQDVVHDFYKFCGLPSLSPQKLRINETPDNTETVLRALYNDGIPDPVLPIEFERLMTRVPSGIRSGQSYLHWLMPTQEDLETVRATSQDDRQKINEILTQQGEPPLADESIKTKDLKVDSDNLAFNLAKILMAQSHRINALEKSIKELEDAALPSSFSKPPSA